MSSYKYWETIEYLGAGFVLQRQVYDDENKGSVVEYYHEDMGVWRDNSPWNDYDCGGTRAKERVIHISDTKIDTTTIDHERLEQ